MILQALKEYYDRKAADPDSGIAPEGFEYKAIPFFVVIDREGNFVSLQFTGDKENFKKGKPLLVPMSQSRSGKDSWKTTNFMWDHMGYVLAVPKSDNEKDVEQAIKQNSVFIRMIESAVDRWPSNVDILAIKKFYLGDQVKKVLADARFEDVKSILGCNLVFRLVDQVEPITSDPNVITGACAWDGRGFELSEIGENDGQGICLVTGDISPISRLHRPIAEVNKKPSPLLAVNDTESPAFSSYNKRQGENFPVGVDVSFKYATALNSLLRRGSRQRVKQGDSSVVFWASKNDKFENDFSELFDDQEKDDPDKQANTVRALLESVNSGVSPVYDRNASFFILGLSPNVARIQVRFWRAGKIGDFADRLAQHFLDIEICHSAKERDYLPLFNMLISVSVLGEIKNIPPNLAGDWMRSILSGLPYPDSLFGAAVRRIINDRDVNYPRAAIIKGYLNRKGRFVGSTEKEMTVSLDKSNQSVGYRLGRLFAVLERIQEQASGGGLNSTIRDRYYASASGTPGSVMPILMRLKNHHLAKLEKGRPFFEALIGEILGDVADFPTQLNLQDQGRFAIGYYHQRQSFFEKNNDQDQGEV